MAKTLKGLVITEVDQIIHETKSLKEAAAKIGVAYQTLLQFRSENMKEFKKLKAEREQGLIVDEVPVVKTKPVEKNKGASTIPVNDVIEKAEHQKIVDDLQVNLALVTDDRDKHKEEVTKLNAERNDFMNKIKELETTITKKKKNCS